MRFRYYSLTAPVMATQGPFIKSPASVEVREKRLLFCAFGGKGVPQHFHHEIACPRRELVRAARIPRGWESRGLKWSIRAIVCVCMCVWPPVVAPIPQLMSTKRLSWKTVTFPKARDWTVGGRRSDSQLPDMRVWVIETLGRVILLAFATHSRTTRFLISSYLSLWNAGPYFLKNTLSCNTFEEKEGKRKRLGFVPSFFQAYRNWRCWHFAKVV